MRLAGVFIAIVSLHGAPFLPVPAPCSEPDRRVNEATGQVWVCRNGKPRVDAQQTKTERQRINEQNARFRAQLPTSWMLDEDLETVIRRAVRIMVPVGEKIDLPKAVAELNELLLAQFRIRIHARMSGRLPLTFVMPPSVLECKTVDECTVVRPDARAIEP
jgi:hypothetical protein